jgi:hypothetical protein
MGTGNIYIIYAERNSSQFNQHKQEMRVKIIEAHRGYFIVESLKRYNKKYAGATKASGNYSGMPVRRINKEQAKLIVDESTGKWLAWETVRRREGTPESPGRARGGK